MSQSPLYLARLPLKFAPESLVPHTITNETSLRLVPADTVLDGSDSCPTLRIAAANTINACWQLGVLNAETKEEIGSFDIRYPVARQCFDAKLDRPVSADDLGAGLELKLISGDPFEVAPGLERPLDAPHLVKSNSEVDCESNAFYQLANASICEIGWMEGCILEGLQALPEYTEEERSNRLDTFLKRFWGRQGLEGTLPIAALARVTADSPFIEKAFELWESHRDEAGIYSEGGRIVAESCLTLAYPMAAIAKLRSDKDLALTALTQLDHCREALFSESSIALRCFEDGQRVFENWARGVGWYVLGHAKTIRELEGWVDIRTQQEALADAMDLAFSHQRPNGLWGSFIDDPACIPDTSGSAIIATAGAIYAQLDSSSATQFRDNARLALEGLSSYLSPDGLLGGATQHNCGGEELQRGNYRVSHPYTLALYAELKSLLSEPAVTP